MGLVVGTLVAAVVAGWLLGGNLSRLSALRMQSWPLLAGAAAAQLAGGLAGRSLYAVGLALSAALALAFFVRNRRLPGIPLVAAGLLLNAVVVAANGGAMPVSAGAGARAGVALDVVAAGLDPRHVLADGSTALSGLGDVVPVALPLHREVASIGDLLVAAGLALLVVAAMRRDPWRLRGWTDPYLGRTAVSGEGKTWRRSPVGVAPARRARPTTASAPTPERRTASRRPASSPAGSPVTRRGTRRY